jgi:5-formyltetrahydrofolate cyclo-ligase
MDKKEYREKFELIRNNLTKEEIELLSKPIQLKLLELLQHINFQKILLYSVLKGEVDLKELIPEFEKHGKEVLVAKTKHEDWDIKSLKTNQTFSNLKEAGFEPNDVVIIPGLAFSKTGVRLGFGGGWYDRQLANIDVIKIGICFDFQLLDELPEEEFDVRMNYIIINN